MTVLIAVLFGIGLPVGFWAWRESRLKNPAARWPELAPQLDMQFLPNPSRLEGQYKGRAFRVLAEADGSTTVLTGLRGRTGLRVEIGPRAEVEKASGMIVPDRIETGDSAFEKRWLVRGQPRELGEAAADPSLRQRLMSLPDIHVLALPDRVTLRVPYPSDASEIRNYLDIAVSVADSVS